MRYGEREPIVILQIRRCGFVLEGRWKLAGGGAQRNHRSWSKTILRPGRDAGPGRQARPILGPAPFQGAQASVVTFPVVTLGLHDRLISAARPAQRLVG
jgi:hypothetical protein